MKKRHLFMLAALAGLPLQSNAIEIATGRMLGAGHDERSFYVREGSGPWRKTYTGPLYKAESAGRLMNLRIAQGLYHDEWLTEYPFDPEKNTDRLIAALDAYKEHGILAIAVSLQAGNPAYERTEKIKRTRPAKLGPEKGSLTSAFRPDGSLKDAWMKRLLRLQRELDKRGMILDLLYFYQHQDEVLENREALDRGLRNVTDWLIDNNCRNVIIEIANEHDSKDYDHDLYIPREMGKLIAMARSRFEAKKAAFRLPVSASPLGIKLSDGVREQGDIAMIHGNNRTPPMKREQLKQLLAEPRLPGPIYMNEDNNGRETTRENLKMELESCDILWEAGGSWGYMPWVQLQNFPFRHYLPGGSLKVADEMPVEQRDPAYFHVVLEHIRKLLLKPEAATQTCKLASRKS